MAWIWLLFAVFSILANILEKAAKNQRPPEAPPLKNKERAPSAPKPVAFPPFFFGEEEEETEKPIVIKDQDFGERSVDQGGSLASSEQIEKTFSATKKLQTNLDFRDRIRASSEAELDHDPFEQYSLNDYSEDWLVDSEESQWGEERKQFLSALVLAQVMTRPDFRTTPWQRRL